MPEWSTLTWVGVTVLLVAIPVIWGLTRPTTSSRQQHRLASSRTGLVVADDSGDFASSEKARRQADKDAARALRDEMRRRGTNRR